VGACDTRHRVEGAINVLQAVLGANVVLLEPAVADGERERLIRVDGALEEVALAAAGEVLRGPVVEPREAGVAGVVVQRAVQEDTVAGVEVALGGLEPVALELELGDVNV